MEEAGWGSDLGCAECAVSSDQVEESVGIQALAGDLQWRLVWKLLVRKWLLTVTAVGVCVWGEWSAAGHRIPWLSDVSGISKV